MQKLVQEYYRSCMDSQHLDEILKTVGPERAEHLLKYMPREKIVELFGSIDLDALIRRDFDFSFDDEHTIFNPYLVGSIFIRPLQLYGKYLKFLEASHSFNSATLYIIAKRKKMRFILDETDFENDYLNLSISVAGEKVTHKLSIWRLLRRQDMPEIKRPYPIFGISINKSNSDENVLAIIIHTPDGQLLECIAFLHDLVSLIDTDIDIDDVSEILYIGQSLKIKDRALSHEKIQRALSEVGDREDVYLYFFNVNEKKVLWNYYHKSAFDNVVEITDEGRLNLIEMALINYFKPRYNTTYIKSEIPLNNQVNKLLKANNYTRIVAELNFDSIFWKFGSDEVKPKQHHAAVYKLNP